MTRQNNPSIALVGANGQVGTELSFLLRSKGFDVVPIVRNKIGAATFERFGFEYRIGEITNNEHADRLLSGVDATVILAHVPWFYGSLPKIAKQTNKKIIRDSIRHSEPNAEVIFFSTLVAFGDEIGLSDWQFYGREKRNLEKTAEDCFEKHGREGYVFRLGHVYGPIQEHTSELIGSLSEQNRVRIAVSANKPSNVVHTVTLAEALAKTVRGEVDVGTYSIVNRPQWTWSDVVAHYLPDHDFSFVDPTEETSSERSSIDETMNRLLTVFAPYQNRLLTLLAYLPDRLSLHVMNRELSNRVTRSISQFEDRQRYDNSHFEYEPVPGPHIDVPPATELLDREAVLRENLGLKD